MTDYYNLTNLTSANDIGDLMRFSNEVTGGVFGLGIMLAIFVVFFMATGERTLRSFAFASFVTTISGIFLVPVLNMPIVFAIMPMALLFISILALMIKR